MIETFNIGDSARLLLRVESSAGAPVDPGAVRVRVQAPDKRIEDWHWSAAEDAQNDPQIVHSATGQFHADIPLDQPGNWYWRWEGDALNAGAVEGRLTVERSRFP